MNFKFIVALFLFFNFATDLFSVSKSEQNKLGKELVKNAKIGDFSEVKDLSTQNANLNYQDADGKDVLMYAVKFDRDDIIKFLANQNIDPNLLDGHNLTALMQAAAKGDFKIVSDLLKFKNLNINKQGRYGQTALDWAYSPRGFYTEQAEFLTKLSKYPKERREIINLLKQHGAKPANKLIKAKEKVIELS